MIVDIIFYVFAFLIVFFALLVVVCRNIFHSAIALSACLSLVAGLFALLGADFLAASQLLVYVGGIVISMLFVIMLSQRPQGDVFRRTNNQWFWGLILSGAVAGNLITVYRTTFVDSVDISVLAPTTAPLGRLLLGQMLVPFEMISLVLLVALVGAVVFGQDTPSDSFR